jgi:hypothetical protein
MWRLPLGGGQMTSNYGAADRAVGVWGARAYAWSGEERPRVAGFAVDPGGAGHHRWFRRRERRETEPAGRRARIVVAVVAILSAGEEEPGD